MAVNAGLTSRLKISVPVIAVLTSAIFLSPPVIKGMVMLVLLRSLWEFFNIFKATLPAYSRGAIPFALLYLGLHWDATEPSNLPLGLIGLLGLFSIQLFVPSKKGGMVRLSITVMGFLYVAVLGSYAFFLYNIETPNCPNWGPWIFFSTIFICKFSDATAYFGGKKFGKHKLIPRVSPNKTWEGLWGAYLGGFIGAPLLLFAEGFSVQTALLFAFILVSIATLGDLFESQFKRELRVKDTANDIPGFGGTMDMIDSVLWALPAAYWFIVVAGIVQP
jgi:phosphatidate cytidylyltransferase